jgi:hypothetical protein
MKTKLTLLLIFLAAFSLSAQADFTLLAEEPHIAAGGSYTLRFVARTTAGNDSVTTNTVGSTLFLIFLQGYTTDPTVSDDQADSPTYRAGAGGSGDRIRLAEMVAPNTNVSHTFTVAGGDGADYRSMIVLGFSGNAGSPYDTSTTTNSGNWGSTGDNGLKAPPITPAQANEQFVSGLSHAVSGNVSIDSGFTILAASTNTAGYFLRVAHKDNVSAATQPKWTTDAGADGGAAIDATYK